MFNHRYTYDALGNLIYRQLPDGENQLRIYGQRLTHGLPKTPM
ncbi:hypothetical protein HMPREF1324_1972 [Rothia aeria F0474]|uniref:RHS repeat protein n=1 Tax=Rothia aeria F0474 TaxID=1125724 RepID=I0UV25_9MICC|nr:hypothetical protein HMPREF1324_1972 [Rothia aeria F0474]